MSSFSSRFISHGTHATLSSQIKATVGKGKFSTRDLPDLAHVYGRKNVKDAENAGQVALNWTAGAASAEETAGLDIIKMNKDAIRAGSECWGGLQSGREGGRERGMAKLTTPFPTFTGNSPRHRPPSTAPPP